jgi:hypothetical protein
MDKLRVKESARALLDEIFEVKGTDWNTLSKSDYRRFNGKIDIILRNLRDACDTAQSALSGAVSDKGYIALNLLPRKHKNQLLAAYNLAERGLYDLDAAIEDIEGFIESSDPSAKEPPFTGCSTTTRRSFNAPSR